MNDKYDKYSFRNEQTDTNKVGSKRYDKYSTRDTTGLRDTGLSELEKITKYKDIPIKQRLELWSKKSAGEIMQIPELQVWPYLKKILGPTRKFIGQTIPEKLAESPNSLIRSYGVGLKKGPLGFFAGYQWIMSNLIGASDEAKRKWINPDMEEIRRTGKIPDNHPAGGGLSWGIVKRFYPPEEIKKVEKEILRVAEAPIHKEKPMGFRKSMAEAVGKGAWAGGEPERYIKDPTPTEKAIFTIAGLIVELKFDPMKLIHITRLPGALKDIKDSVIKSSDIYDFTRKFNLEKLKLNILTKNADDYRRITTAFRANWIRENSTEWVAALQRLGSGAEADKYFNLDELSSLYALQRIDPEITNAINNVNAVDKTKFGLMLGKKQLLSEEKLNRVLTKIGIPLLAEKTRESLVGEAFTKFHKLSKTQAEELKMIPRFQQASTRHFETLIAPTLKKVAKQDEDAMSMLMYGEDALKGYYKYKGFDEVVATAETLRMKEKYSELMPAIRETYKTLIPIDKAYKIDYPEIKNYMAGFMKKTGEGKFKIPNFALNKTEEWYQKMKIYENPLEALKAGENPVLNINDIMKIRIQATFKAVWRRIGLDTFDTLYGTSHPRTGYKLVNIGYLEKGKRYFPERIADALQHEEDFINLGNIGNKIRKNVEAVSSWWKRQVTLRLPTFHVTNLTGGTEIDVADYGLDVLKKTNNKIGWDIWSSKNLDDIVTTDSGLKYSKRVLKFFMDSSGAGSGHTRHIIGELPMAKWDIWALKGGEVGQNIEGFMRSRSWWMAFKSSDDPIFATMKTFMNHFDYNDLTAFEKTFINTSMAFWTFRKNIAVRTTQLMLGEPGRYGALADVVRGIEEMAGGRDPSKEPDYFQEAQHIKLPIKYKGHYIYMDVQELPIHALSIPSALMGAVEAKTEPDKDMWVELFKPITGSFYPWWKVGLQKLMNRDMFLNRQIVPDWAKGDPSYRVVSSFGFIAWLPKSLKKEMGIEYKIIKGQKRLMIKPQYNELIKALPLTYQARLMFASSMYADYKEQQQLFDLFYTLTGIRKFRTIDEAYYQGKYQEDKEKRREEEIKQYLYQLKEDVKKRD